MHDNPLRIKVEVEDASASPSPAPKITGTDVEMKDLMSDVGSLKAFAEATTESATAVADIIDPIEHGGLVEPSATAEASAVAEESAAAAAAVTMMGMGGGGCQCREAACEESRPHLRHGYRGGEWCIYGSQHRWVSS